MVDRTRRLTIVVLLVLLVIGVAAYPSAQPPAARAAAELAFGTIDDDTYAVALGDLNADGFLDVVTGNVGAPGRIYLNNRTANPLAGVTGIPFGSGGAWEQPLSVGDVDRDGDLDIVAEAMYRNDGTGTMWEHIAIPATGLLGDVDGDTWLDLVTAARWYSNNRSGGDPWAGVDGQQMPGAILRPLALGDLNADARLDLVVAVASSGSDEQVAVILHSGGTPIWRDRDIITSGLVLPAPSGSERRITDAELADIDGDGRVDIVTAYAAYRNGGDGQIWQPIAEFPTEYGRAFAVGSLSGGELPNFFAGPDFDVRWSSTPAMTFDSIAVYNNGTSRPWLGVGYAGLGSAVSAVALGDFNNDGTLDIILGNRAMDDSIEGSPVRGFEHIIMGATGSPWSRPEGYVNVALSSIAPPLMVDLTGDGVLDVIDGGRILLKSGTGLVFEHIITYASQPTPLWTVITADLNGDQSQDIIAGSVTGSQVYLNGGDGRTWELVPGSPGQFRYSPQPVDIDGDGDQDLLFAGGWLLRNDGDGRTWAGEQVTSVDLHSYFADDLNGDGHKDLVALSRDRQIRLFYYGGVGGGWQERNTVLPTSALAWLKTADFNGDGRRDLVAGRFSSGPPYVLLQRASGQGWDIQVFQHIPGSSDSPALVGDLDGSGRDSLVSQGRVYRYRDTGWEITPLPGSSTSATNWQLFDIDRDNDLDIFADGLYINNGANGWERRNYPAAGIIVDLNGDRNFDIVTRNRYFLATAPGVWAAQSEGTSFTGDQLGTLDRVIDIDGDGDLDIVARTNAGLRFYLNRQDQLLWQSERFGGGVSPANFLLGDVNGDGRDDLVETDGDNQLRLYLNDGDAAPWDSAGDGQVIGVGSADAELKDVNNDNFADLIFGGGPELRLLLSDGSANPYHAAGAGLAIRGSGSLQVGPFAVGDLTGDGFADIVGFGTSGCFLLQNSGRPDNPWQDAQGSPVLSTPIAGCAPGTLDLQLAHLDADGQLDLLATVFVPRVIEIPGKGRTNLQQCALSAENFSKRNTSGDQCTTLAWSSIRFDAISRSSGGAWQTNTVGTDGFAGSFLSAVGDVNADGIADILRPTTLFLSEGGAWRAQLLLQEFGLNFTSNSKSKLGDIDGDGDLDVATISGSFLRIFLNNSSGASWIEAAPLLTAEDYTALAVGTIDGGPSAEIIVGAGPWNAPLRQLLKVNPLPELFRSPLFPALPQRVAAGTRLFARCDSNEGFFSNTPMLRADLDGDGDCDVVTGASNAAGVVFRAVGLNPGILDEPWEFIPLSNSPSGQFALTAGDVDSDGDLDLITGDGVDNGNPAPGAQIYLNSGDARAWSGHELPNVTNVMSVALGDTNADGRPDLLVGTSDWNSQTENGSSISNDEGGIRLYLNDGAPVPFLQVVPKLLSTKDSYGIVAIDGDLDSDVDLLAVTGAELRLVRNDNSRWTTTLLDEGYQYINAFSYGNLLADDVTDDGLFDIVAQNQLWLRNTLRRDPLSIAAPLPTLSLAQPEPNLILSTPTITLKYTIRHPQGRGLRSLRAEYSPDGGGRWLPAIPRPGTPTTNLSGSPAGTIHTFAWDTLASGFSGNSDNVVIRLLGVPDLRPQPNDVGGSFQRAQIVTQSQPMRVRGTQARVTKIDGSPVPDALVYMLPANQNRDARLTPPRREGHAQLLTDHLGYLQGRGSLAPGDRLVALQPITHTATYTLYHTSARPVDTGFDMHVVQSGGTQTLTVSPENPLMLLNLDISLEWDARNDTQFLDQLQRDLRRASDLLYDWTNGQVALGDLTIYHDQEHWNDAHIRIFATNRLRPNAVKGGIVEDVRLDPDEPTPDTPSRERYEPGQIRMGAVWNRYGEATTNLGDDWSRTLAHELGHYALFLDDNYLGLDQQGRLISVGGCPGAMSDPYRDDWGEFHPSRGWLPDCAGTLSQFLNQRDDWSTITRFYPALRAPTGVFTETLRGPNLMPLALPRIRIVAPATSSTTVADPFFFLTAGQGQPLAPPAGGSARSFLFQAYPESAGGDRLVDLGAPTADQVRARGARPGDRLCVYELAQARSGCAEVGAGFQEVVVASYTTARPWQPDLRITPVSSTTLHLDVLNVPTTTLRLKARLYPGSGPATAPMTLTQTISGYTGLFLSSPDLPTLEGLIHVWVDEAPGSDPPREAIVEFVTGGNPGKRRSVTAPRSNPGKRRSVTAPVLSGDGLALLFRDPRTEEREGDLYTLLAVPRPPTPPPYATPVGQAYRLSTSPGITLTNTSLNLAYLGDSVPRGQEDGLRLYRYDDDKRTWEPLASSLDARRNEVTATIDQPGLYQLMTSVQIDLSRANDWNPAFFYPGVTQPITQALAGIDGIYTTVYGYDNADLADPWKVYDRDVPEWVNELADLQNGASYWIRVTEAVTAPVRGPGPIVSLDSAMRSGPLPLPPATYFGVITSTETFTALPDLPVVASIDGTTCGRSLTRAVDGQIVFAVDVLARGPGAALSCGVPGAEVVLTVGERRFTATWDNQRPRNLFGPPLSVRRVLLPLIHR